MFLQRINIMPSTSYLSSLHYSRKLILHTPYYNTPTPLAPTSSYQLSPSSSPVQGISRFDANVVMILSVLLFALIGTLCVNVIIKCMVKCLSLITQGPNQNSINVLNQQIKVGCGVNKKVLSAFLVVNYTRGIKGLDTECVICLSELEVGEKVKILPKCSHGFHVLCIDKWLTTHSSCPTCRQQLSDTSCQKISGCVDEHQANSSAVNVAEERL